MNPRTPIEDLRLAGSGNLRRALKREEADAALPAPKSAAEEVSRLDELIANAMNACKRGQTVSGKKNPAFLNLSILVKIRKMILERGGIATTKTSGQIIAEANAFLSEVN